MLRTFECQEIGRHRNDEQIASENRVQRQDAEERAAVDNDRSGDDSGCAQRASQARNDIEAFPEQRIELGEVEMRRAEKDAAVGDLGDVGQRALAHEKCVDRIIGKTRMNSKYAG